MNNKASEILKNIEKKRIRPKSRWIFLVKDCLIWALFVLTTLIGAVAVGVIIFIINDNDWDIYRYLEKNIWSYFLILVPYFWIIILVLFSLLAYFNYMHTRKGYLLNPYLVIFSSILFSIILGWILFNNGIGEKIDKIFAQKVPYYKNTEMHKNVFWNNPEKGLLAGEIIEIEDKNSFTLKDLEKNSWNIVGDNILWKEKVLGIKGEKIKIIGKIKNGRVFDAKEIRPWGCGCNSCVGDELNKHNSCITGKGNGEKESNRSINCATD